MQLSANKFKHLKTIASRLEVTKLFGFAITVSTLLLPAHVFALGIRIADQDAFAIARGNAFAATADNPSAIAYNPAGISQLDGFNARVGGYGIFINDHYHNDTFHSDVNNRQRLEGIAQLYATYTLPQAPVSLGVGAYMPYGFGLNWPDNAPFNALPTVPKFGMIEYLTINPVIAFKPHKTLSISAGPTFNHAEADLRFTPGGEPNSFKFRGRDDDTGFNAGILWQPCDKHSFGLAYRSQTTMDFKGHSDLHIPSPGPNVAGQMADAKFQFPQNVTAGYSFRPTTNWNLELNVDWTDWHRLNTVALNNQFTGASAIPMDWQNSWFFEFGGTYYFENAWHLSAGYIYSMNSVPSATFNPAVPDSDRHILSVGIGKTYKHFSWDATYQFAYGPDRDINNGAGNPISGTYRFISHAIALSAGYHF
jgi:long-chain fatty acid transport protein